VWNMKTKLLEEEDLLALVRCLPRKHGIHACELASPSPALTDGFARGYI
jgi:hypothetical protein